MGTPARSLATQIRLLKPSVPYLVPAPPPVEKGVAQIIQGLDPAISRRITSGTELLRSLNRRQRDQVLPTTVAQIDALLNGGIARGKMIEIAGRGIRYSLIVATLAAATSIGEAAALIDLGDAFDPQIGEAAGIDLRRLLWIRPHKLKEAVAAAEMVVSTGFQLVVVDVGSPNVGPPTPAANVARPPSAANRSIGRVPDAAWMRLARAAEAHGTALIISSPYPLTGTTSEAMLRTERPRAKWRNGLLVGIETGVRLEKHRRKRPGESASLLFRTPEAFV